MANSRETITKDIVFNIKTKVTDAERAASEIKNALSKINVSDDLKESLSSALVDLTANIDKLKGKLSSTMSPSEIQKWNKQWNGVSDTLNDIVHTMSSGKLSPKDVIFDETTQKRIDKIKSSLELIAENKSKINKSVGTRTDALVSGLTKENQLKTAKDLGLTVQAQKDIYSATFKNLDNEQAINDLLSVRAPKYKEILAAQQKINSLTKASAEASALKDEVLSSKGRLTNDTKQKILASSAVDTTGLDITSNKAAFLAAFDKTSVTDYSTAIKEANAALVELQTNQQQQAYASWSSDLVNSAKQLASTLNLSEEQSEQLKQELINLATQGAQKAEAGLADFKTVILQLLPLLKQVGDTAEEGSLQLKKFEARQTFFSDMQTKISQIFGLANAYQGLTRFIRASWTAIKELDAAFTEIAVVTDKTTGDLWKSFDTYNDMAQQLGVTTTDAIETSALYYQQGLDTADVMTLTTETIKMARIANMDFADATQAMTSAIRGFKLEMSDAQTITDTYSALAAEAAVDTDQLATAISKTASIAGSAGLSLQDTSAFLTQIIETTQEAPETAGTALKTIIARFTELKKNPATLKVDVEGEEVSANKIEEALRTADVALRDTEGNFRDLDDVFLELSSKWDSLDRNTQRYIATTAAGSRQQSRFIAMMDNYERTMELVGIANDSAGAGAIQFAKTLDSVSARVNKLKSNFEALIGNLVENDTVKGILDILNTGMKILVNASEKGIVAFSALIFLVGKTIKDALSLIISQFAKVSKENETLRTKIGRIIKVPVVYEPDVSAVNQVNQQLKANPIMVPSSKVVPKPGDSDFIGPLKQMTGQTFTSAISGVKGQLTSTVASGVSTGLLVGFTSDNWKLGLASGLTSTITSAIGNPKITSAIGSILVKGGTSTIGKTLAGIGVKLAAALPTAGIVAGVALVGYGLYKWLDPVQRANRELKKAQDNLDKVNSSLESSRANYLSDVSKVKSISSNIDEYKKLTSQIGLTTDEQTQLNDVTTKLAEQFPQIITGYTEAGQVIIDQKTNWQEILKLQKESIALSQAQYASDVVGAVDAKEDVRAAELKTAQQDLDVVEANIQRKAEKEAYDTSPAQGRNESYKDYNKRLADAAAIITSRIKETDAEYQAAFGKVNGLIKQEQLYEQERVNAYKQIADSLVSTYQASTTNGNGKVDSQISEIAQNELARRVEGLGLDWNTEDEEVKKDNIAKAQAEADKYLIALQDEFESSNIDMSKVAEHIATDTDEQFVSFLEGRGITAKGANAELYATLKLDFDTKNKGVQEVLDLISGKTKSDKYTGTKVKETDIQDVMSNEAISAAYANMGKEAGASYINELYRAVISGSISKDIANYLGTLNIATEEEAKTAAAYIASTFDMPYTAAVNIVFRYKQDPDGIIDRQGLFSSSGIQSYFDDQQDINSADVALESLNNGMIDLAPEQTKALVEEFPELSGALKTFANDSEKSAEAIDILKRAIIKASDNKKSIEYFKKLSEQIKIIKDTASTPYLKQASKDILKDSLGITDLKDADKIIDTYQSDIEAAANGSVEAWNRVKTAIKEARLAEIGFKSEDQEKVSGFVNDLMTELDTLTNGDYSAEFTLSGTDKTSLLFQGVLTKIEGLKYSAEQAAVILEAMSGLKIEPSWEMVNVPVPMVDGKDPGLAGVHVHNGSAFMSVPKVTYKVTKGNNTYNPDYVGGSSGNSSGGSDDAYEVKTDKYYNEINAIEDLTRALDKLTDARENGNLSAEDYQKNVDQTISYYKQLQDTAHNYAEGLRADRAEIVNKILELKVPKAVTVVDGKAVVNKAELDALALTNKTAAESADELIAELDAVDKAIDEQVDSWWDLDKAKREIADSFRDSFTSSEDKIRDILIKQDQDKIDALSKKYDKMKQADTDYLDALKDNIDKRRAARDKENDYEDLAKKEKRLALLKRDTSGVYGAEILSLEEEISQTRQDLSDQEVDDMVANLEESASKKATAYDKELAALQTSQDDKEKSMIEYNKAVDKIMQSGADNILKWLQTYDKEYTTASAAAQEKYLEDWKNTINEAEGYKNNVINGTIVTTKEVAAKKAQLQYSELSGISTDGLENASNPTYAGAVSDLQGLNAAGALDWYNQYIKERKGVNARAKELMQLIIKNKFMYETGSIPKNLGFSEGGLVDYTGPATVHGSPTKPEAFLSADDTKNFQILAQLLNNAIGYKGGVQANTPAGTRIDECNITIEVETLSSDYDVQKVAAAVKDIIVGDISSDRQINITTRVR